MIDKREILEQASGLGLLPSIVEKDYVLGWLLAGIDAHPVLGRSWVFKGGTCLKKCYFETYRFSEDLGFTLRDEGQLTDDFLRGALTEVVAWVADQSGLTMPADQIAIDIYGNPRGRPSCYAYEEAFGEKIRALGERTRPRDLYDVVNLYRHGDNRPAASILRNVLEQKCAYKAIAVPTIEALTPHRADVEAMWDNMLGHQLPVLPPVADFGPTALIACKARR